MTVACSSHSVTEIHSNKKRYLIQINGIFYINNHVDIRSIIGRAWLSVRVSSAEEEVREFKDVVLF